MTECCITGAIDLDTARSESQLFIILGIFAVKRSFLLDTKRRTSALSHLFKLRHVCFLYTYPSKTSATPWLCAIKEIHDHNDGNVSQSQEPRLVPASEWRPFTPGHCHRRERIRRIALARQKGHRARNDNNIRIALTGLLLPQCPRRRRMAGVQELPRTLPSRPCG